MCQGSVRPHICTSEADIRAGLPALNRGSMSTETIERPDTKPQTGSGSGEDHIKAHYILPPVVGMSPQAWVTEATMLGIEVTAICGYRWVPTRDASRHGICKACSQIAAQRIVGS